SRLRGVWQRNPPGADVRAADRWNAHGGPQRGGRDPGSDVTGTRRHRAESVGALEHRDHSHREPATKRLSAPGVRVVGDPVAASKHCRVVHLLGKSKPRSEKLLAPPDVVVLRDSAAPAN